MSRVNGAQPGANVRPGKAQESITAKHRQVTSTRSAAMLVDPTQRHLEALRKFPRRENIPWF